MTETTAEMAMSPNELYREEVITDRRVGTVRRLIPITADGAEDASRPVQYIGSAQVLTPGGALPLSFELQADSLEQAVEQFAGAAEQALQSTVEELKEMQRQAASSIVVPKSGADPSGGLGGLGGGGIQMP